jgi:hypothetical protein
MGLPSTRRGDRVGGAPALGQVELLIQRRHAAGGDAHQEHADLAVVLLAQPPVVLPGDAGAVIPLLGEAARVDDADDSDRAVGGGRDQFVDEDRLDLGLDVAVVPGGVVDELLQGRDLPVADVQGDRLDALTLGADHQPFDIGVGVVLGLFSAEQGGETLVEVE